MSTDYRALCAELLPLASSCLCAEEMVDSAVKSIDRARAALAQPEPEGLTNEELPPRVGHILRLAEIIREVDGAHDKGAAALAESILSHPGSRWRPAIEPVPVSERLPELRGMFERILSVDRYNGRSVSHIQLADRLIDAVVSWSGDALPVPGAEVG